MTAAQWFGVGWMHRYLEKQVAWYTDHLRLIGSAVILRPTLVYGPYDDFSPETGHFVPVLVRKVVHRVRPIEIWGDGTQRRNLLYAADLAKAILAVLPERSERLEVFNVASPDDTSINEIVGHLLEISGFGDAVVTHDATKGGGPSALAVCGNAFGKATGWIARKSIRDGFRDTMAWLSIWIGSGSDKISGGSERDIITLPRTLVVAVSQRSLLYNFDTRRR